MDLSCGARFCGGVTFCKKVGMGLSKYLLRIPELVRREWDYARRHLRGCCLEPTYRCNLRCKMCGVHTLTKPGDKGRELSREDILRVVDELGQMGAKWLQLIGGEPLLRPEEMMAATARANQLGIKTTIVTNGTLINEEMARGLVAVAPHAITFSVDGVGEAHDRVRGLDGAFERVQRGMRLILEERGKRRTPSPAVEIQSTLSRLNWDQVAPLLRFKDQIGADSIVFIYVSEISVPRLEATRLNGVPLCTHRWAPGEASALFSPTEVAAFKKAIENAPDNKATRIFRALDEKAYTHCHFPTRRCYFMRDAIIINPFGDAYPCPHLDACVIGNVREAGLKGIWQNERHRQVIAGLGERMYPVCSSCCAFGHNLTLRQIARLGLRKML